MGTTMTIKRYLEDSYCTSFTARIIKTEKAGTLYRVKLSETWFYPESGGQPADMGTLGNARVVDVQQENGDVIHFLESAPEEKECLASVDWSRRHTHMQQHSGQHMLSAAAVKLLDASTVGFHLGDTISTVDLDIAGITPEKLEDLELLCQQWIIENHTISSSYLSKEEFAAKDLRKKNIPDHIDDRIRLITIEDVDVCHCGGTHLRSTAEIQTIKIIATEKVRGVTRLHFLAGERAINDYWLKHDLASELSKIYTTGIEDLKQIVVKQQRDNKKLTARVALLEKKQASILAEKELPTAEHCGDFKFIIKKYSALSDEELRLLARAITRLDDQLVFAAIVSEPEKTTLICTAGKKYDGDLGPVVQEVTSIFNAKGGGRGTYAQAVGAPGHEGEVIEALQAQLLDKQ
jgi:alanyl-tRNA synthetase